ncbi:MAG: hypothetical protein H6667_12565 [Ardenticatenaceae bacterium]|nr:hypothetical protein [Ardenticatenaceae bacterium]
MESRDDRDLSNSGDMRLLFSDGDTVVRERALTEEFVDPHPVLEILGADAVTQYFAREVQGVSSAGPEYSDKHLKRLFARC